MKLTQLTATWRRVSAGILAVGFAATCVAQAPNSEPQLDYRAAADYSTANEGVSMLVMQSGEIIFENTQMAVAPTRPG